MKADYIKEIVRNYEILPYECILIDGVYSRLR